MVRVASSSDEAARVWHAGFGGESERRKQATSNKHLPADRSRCDAQLLHGGPLPQRRGGGAGTASKTLGFNWRHCCGAVALLSTQDLLTTRAEACRGVRARCRGLHAVIIEMAHSMHATLTAASIFQARPRSEKPMTHRVACY